MKQSELREAIGLNGIRINNLKDWIVSHHNNPYVSTIAADIRNLEDEIRKLEVQAHDTYPTMEEVKSATGRDVLIIMRLVPLPKNDDQREVYEYIKTRIKQYTTT